MNTDKYFQEKQAGYYRAQSDCVHEQVAKADCECPLYLRKRKQKIRKEIAKFGRCTEIRFCSLFLYAV